MLGVDRDGLLGRAGRAARAVARRSAEARHAAWGQALATSQTGPQPKPSLHDCYSGDPMGAWGTGVFDNDGAGDLLGDLRDAEPGQRVDLAREALQLAVDTTDYLEVTEGEAAVAAAAVIAAARSGQGSSYSDGTERFAADFIPLPSGTDLALARQALDRVIGEQSEWRELWEEAGNLDAALAAIAEVRAALGSEVGPAGVCGPVA